MEKEIKVTSDSGTVSAGFRDGSYYIRVIEPGHKLPHYARITEEQAREIRVVLEEVIQLNNKQDY